MSTKKFADLADRERDNPGQVERIGAFRRAIDDVLRLAELRSRRGVTQQQLAATLHVTQANISRIERNEDLYLSTLRGYVAALGGELEINAVFPDGSVALVATPE